MPHKKTPDRKAGSFSIFSSYHCLFPAGNKREQLVLLIEYPAIGAIQRAECQSEIPADDRKKKTNQPADNAELDSINKERPQSAEEPSVSVKHSFANSSDCTFESAEDETNNQESKN